MKQLIKVDICKCTLRELFNPPRPSESTYRAAANVGQLLCCWQQWSSTPIPLEVLQGGVWPQKVRASLLLSAHATQTRGPVKGCHTELPGT